MADDTDRLYTAREHYTAREMELVKELFDAKIEGVNEKIDGVEKWVKWGALGIAFNAVAVIGMNLSGTERVPAEALGAIWRSIL